MYINANFNTQISLKLLQSTYVRARNACFCFSRASKHLIISTHAVIVNERFAIWGNNNIHTLQASGRVTYNGHGMQEFVPERTSAYISQHDLHIPEMTVRETLAFSARCQGVGARFGMTSTLEARCCWQLQT
jgi:hypothetical protein